MRMTNLQAGWPVVCNDGRRLGTVKDVGQQYVQTSRAGRAADLYVPASAIANVSGGIVQLNLAIGDAQKRGWEQPPRGDDTIETVPESDLHRHV